MPKITNKKTTSRTKLFLFKEAELMEFSSGWQIRYKYMNIETGELELGRERFQNQRRALGEDKRARIAGHRRCQELNAMLKKGWTPYGHLDTEEEEEQEGTLLTELMLVYEKVKERELRFDSMRSIRSYNKLLCAWLKDKKLDKVTIENFTPKIAHSYLDYIIIQKKVSNCTYNNYVSNLRAMWNFFINERQFEVSNPFEKLKKKTREKKYRQVIPREWDNRILDYCRTHDPVLELISELIYHSYMRPAEILRCKIKYVNLQQQMIMLPGHVTKKNNARNIYLSNRAVEILIENKIGDCELDNHLIVKSIGNKGRLAIGKGRIIKTPELDRNWDCLRKAIDLPKEYQLYSWRDTGVTDLAQLGLSDDEIIKITGHLDKEMVDIYRSPSVDTSVLRLLSQVSSSIGHRQNPIDEKERLLTILNK